MSLIEIVPLSRDDARRYVAEHHRHNEPPVGHRFSLGLCVDGELRGVVIAGHPNARMNDDGRTLEITRLTTVGDRNACTRLYGAACRAAKAMGFHRVITYTLQEEGGASLRAAGFVIEESMDSYHADWGHNRTRVTSFPRMFDEPKLAVGPKHRWVRWLVERPTR